MTVKEIDDIVTTTEAKISEIKAFVTDMNACQNERSKAILLAAASKLADVFKPQSIIR